MRYFPSLYRSEKMMALIAGLLVCWAGILVVPVQASMEAALFAARNRDFDGAFRLFLVEAKQGDPEAQYRLAGMYRAGQGTPKNNAQAQEWYGKAAAMGHRKSQKKLLSLEKNSALSRGMVNDREEKLLKAARKGDAGAVRKLLKAGTNVNYQDKFGITALMETARLSHAGLSALLLNSGAKTEFRNGDGDSALLIAARTNNLAVVKNLIKSGADMNVRDGKKCTPLILAAYRNDQLMAEYLLTKGADIFVHNAKGRTVYDIARGYKNEKLVNLIALSGGKRLVRMGEEQAKKQSLQRLEFQVANNKKRGWTAVMYGAWRGDERAVRAALAKTYDLEVRDSDGMTALALAAQGGHLQIIYNLLEAGADLRCGDHMEKHPFFVASGQGHAHVVHRLLPALKDSSACEKLLEKTLGHSLLKGQMDMADMLLEAGVAFADETAFFPLVKMAAKADDGLVTRLIKSGVKVNGVNQAGETALMVAARHGNEVAVKSLLGHQAAIDIKDSSGRTALVHAAQNGHITSVKYLAGGGADILSRTKEGNTALMLAAGKGYISVVSFLSDYENLDHKNNIGDTALIMAARGGFYEVSEILLKQGANPRMRNNKRQRAQAVVDADNGKLLALMDHYETSRSWIRDIF